MQGIGDFDNDGNVDIMDEQTTGRKGVWYMTGTAYVKVCLHDPYYQRGQLVAAVTLMVMGVSIQSSLTQLPERSLFLI